MLERSHLSSKIMNENAGVERLVQEKPIFPKYEFKDKQERARKILKRSGLEGVIVYNSGNCF